MERLRISYSKTESMRYTGNLDIHKIWERTLRRARLPLAYSNGFHPQPRIHQACPLPLGMLSQAEMIDIWLNDDLPVDQVWDGLNGSIPPGLELSEIHVVDLHEPALPTQVLSAEFIATLLEDISENDLESRIAELLNSPALPRERRGKKYDLRPLIEALHLIPPSENGQQRLFLRLSAREGATGRADEVLAALGIDMADARILRTALVMVN